MAFCFELASLGADELPSGALRRDIAPCSIQIASNKTAIAMETTTLAFFIRLQALLLASASVKAFRNASVTLCAFDLETENPAHG